MTIATLLGLIVRWTVSLGSYSGSAYSTFYPKLLFELAHNYEMFIRRLNFDGENLSLKNTNYRVAS